ncbi:Hsp20/alpha crystallin family protein [Streptomyces sp. NPDC058145]|uniref:Hsp20/alpha crystallin family protein n=1 Tax=Streptomyces sp. NPDC058145 TaxID=3346356 RepID=UPI0036F01A5D
MPRPQPRGPPLPDVTETDDAFEVEIQLPGVKSKDIDVEANGQDLVVTGEFKEKERKGVLCHGTRRTGTFEYRLRLPGEVDAEKVTADMSAGVLTVTVPKAEVTKPRHIRITEINESGGH